MKRKLDRAKIASIQEQRAAGATFEDLAREHGISIGSVANALKAPAVSSAPKKRGPKVAAGASEPASTELPSVDDLRRSLAAQVRALQDDATNAETPAQRATANRLLVAATQLLARVTPPDPNKAPSGMMLVPVDEMEKFAEQGEKRLDALIHNALENVKTWPRCAACGQAVEPKERKPA